MYNNRKDDVDKYFKDTQKVSKILKILFWINTSIAIISIILNEQSVNKDINIVHAIIIIQIIISIIYVVLNIYNDMVLKNRAENIRRKAFLKNGLGENIVKENTNQYYNNNLVPSIKRLGVNTFENIFFTKNILDKMIIKSFIKGVFVIITYLLIICFFKDLNVLLVITQTVFSAEVLMEIIIIVYYNINVNNLYDQIYKLFIVDKTRNNNRDIAKILDLIFDYECLKYYVKINLDSKIFDKLNASLSKEWKDLEDKIK